MSSKEHGAWMLSLAVVLLALAVVVHVWPMPVAQEARPIRRPTGRVGGPTLTPTETPTTTPTADPCSACPAPGSLACEIAWNACVQCWADCGQPIATPTPTQPPTPTRTPTPAGPCDHCPDPDSFTCTISWAYCVQCWADCGQPIATPTPTAPTPTPTPTPTTTPAPGECRFFLEVTPGQPKEAYAIAYYLHESEAEPGVRYRSNPPLVREGGVLRADTEGHPVAIEWYVRPQGVGEYEVVSTCGALPSAGYPLFKDGFESGDLSAWVEVVDD